MKTRIVVVNFNPTTNEVTGVHLLPPHMSTAEEAQETCDALNPTDQTKARCRVGVLVWNED